MSHDGSVLNLSLRPDEASSSKTTAAIRLGFPAQRRARA
jgi:hypothetical protein